jgi:hypothetical protein
MWNIKEHYIYMHIKDRAVPLQVWNGLEGSRKLRFPDLTVAQDDGKVVSLTHRPHLPSGNTPRTHFCWGLSWPRPIVLSEGLCQWKIPMTPSGIEPATFWFVAHYLNHGATAVPLHLHAYVTIKLQEKWNTYCSVDGSLRAHGEDRGDGAFVILQRMFNKLLNLVCSALPCKFLSSTLISF